MKQLQEVGFQAVGHCELDNALPNGVLFTLGHLAARRIVYAFVVETQLKYIGICDNSTRTLRDRMDRYQEMTGSGQDKRITSLIQQELLAGRRVFIWALNQDSDFKWKDPSIDLVKGFENSLLKEFKPEWNRQGT